MSEDPATNAPRPTAAEVQEVIAGLEQYRDRIASNVMEMAKKLKLSKKQATENLANHPEIADINAKIQNLRDRLGSGN